MATESEPVRISAEGDSALEELTQLYEQTQNAIAAGDLAALARASAAARQAEVDAIMADMPA